MRYFPVRFCVILVIHQAIVYNNVIFCFRSLNPLPAEIHHLRTHSSSISSSLGSIPAQKRPRLSDIKTWRKRGDRPTRSSSSLEQAAWHGSRANERIGQRSSSKRFYLFQRPRGVVVVVVVVSKAASGLISLDDHVGSSIIIIIIEASNLDEGQGLEY